MAVQKFCQRPKGGECGLKNADIGWKRKEGGQANADIGWQGGDDDITDTNALKWAEI